MTTPIRIFEFPVYCGSQKQWRVLNALTGTVYSPEHDTIDQAAASIIHGEKRGDNLQVFKLTPAELLEALNAFADKKERGEVKFVTITKKTIGDFIPIDEWEKGLCRSLDTAWAFWAKDNEVSNITCDKPKPEWATQVLYISK